MNPFLPWTFLRPEIHKVTTNKSEEAVCVKFDTLSQTYEKLIFTSILDGRGRSGGQGSGNPFDIFTVL